MATVNSSKRHLVLTSDTYESNSDVVVGGNLTITGSVTATTINTGQGATEVYLMNQNVRTSDNVQFADVTVTGDLNITGDINSTSVTNLDVDDKTITIAKGAADSAAADGAGIVVDGASASLLYDHTGTQWEFNKPVDVKVGSSAITMTEYGNGATIWLDGVNGDFIGGDYFGIHAYSNTSLDFSYGAATKMSMTNAGVLTTTGLDINGNADISGNITNATWAGDIIAEAKLQNQSGTNTGDNSANTHSSMFIDRGDVNVTTTSGGSNNNPFDNAHTETKIAENGARSISYTGASAHLFTSFVGGSASVLQLGAHYNGDDFYMRVRTDGSSWKNWRKLWHDNYHPNADKWTTARTLSLTGEVTGSVSWDGSGNASLATTLNNSSLDDQYVTVGSRHAGDGSALSAASKASIRIWDVSAASDDPSGASDGLVLTAGWDSNDWAVQQYHDFHSNDLYLRSKQSGTWMTTWDRVFHDTYHPNADKWTTARTITLGGDLSGSVSIDGSANVTLSAQVTNNSHTHDDRYYTETEINENLAALKGWVPAYSNTDVSSVRWNFTEDALQIQSSTDTTTGASFKARRITSGEKIRITIMAKASAAASNGVYFRMYQHNGDMPNGKTHVSNDASNSSVLVQEDDAGVTNWHENSSITTGWVTYEKEYTATADGYISLVILNWTNLGTNSLYIKNPDIQTVKAGSAATADSYTETDTLATVTGRGASTTTSVTFNTITMNTPVVGSSNKIKFANNDYIRYDDTANRWHFDVDGGTSNGSLQATTFVGALSGNASSVTNGFYTTGNQTASGVKTFSGTLDVSGVAKNVLSQSYVEIYIYGDDDKYYPVTIGGASSHYGYQKYHVSRRYNWTAPSTWNTSTHMGALSLTWEHGSDTAWGGNDKEWRVIQFDEVYTTVCNGMSLPVTEGMVVWLRGGGTGGARYRVSTPQGAGATVKIYDNKTSGASGSGTHVGSTTFTAGDGSTYAAESYSSTNVNNRIKEFWPVRGKTEHYRGQHQILAAIDEDNFVSNSATRVPTQQSTKAYVDAHTYSHNHAASDITSGTFPTSRLDSSVIFGNNSSGTNESNFTNWNDLSKTGFYSDDGATGKWTTANWSSVMHFKLYDDNNNYASQLGFDTYNSDFYYRMKNNGTWTSWYEVYHEGHLPTWSEVSGKPTTFTPSQHSQAWSTISSTPTTLAGYGITDANGDLRFNDSEMILLGSSTSNPSQDARIYHNGTDTYFENATGELRLMSDAWALRSSTSEILSYNTTDDIIKSTAKALQLGNGSVGSSDARLICKRMDTAVADDIQFFNGTTRVGEIGVKDTTWLRINQTTAKNIYTPRYIRADGGFFVDSTSKGINGSGNFIGGTITGASDANVSNWNTAYTHSQSAHAPSNAQANVINYISLSGTNNYIKLHSDLRGSTVSGDGEIVYLYPSNDDIASRAYVSDLPFIRNNADDTFTGKLVVGSSSSRRAGMYGIYNSSLIGHIWSMGTAYQIPENGANFGNLYGLAYKHTNNTTGGTMAGSHQMVWCQNGTGKSAMGTNIWTSGSYTGASISVTGSASFVTSGTGTLTCGGAGIFGGSGTGDVYVGNFGSGNFARFHTNNSNTYFDMNCGVVYWRQGSNTRFQNNMTNGTFTASGDVVAYGSPSDVRLKENIKPIESALDKVSRLQGVTFDWKQSDSILNIKEDVGFIAQDVQKVVPELVRENEDGMLSMRHQGIAPILLEAIKELKAEIEELKKCNKCNNCNCKTNNDGGTK